jgi:hypothetical protein
MSETTLDAAEIGPTIDLADVSLPPDVAGHLQTLYGTDGPLDDAAAWIEATRTRIDVPDGDRPTVEDLCTSADGAHRFEAADGDVEQAYVCVLDPLAYPFIAGTPGRIESTTQVREETVTIDVGADGVSVSHPEAVVSIGVSEYVEPVDRLAPEVVYRQVCGYTHLFADQAEYETWDASVEAATTPVSVETGIGVSKAIADALFP